MSTATDRRRSFARVDKQVPVRIRIIDDAEAKVLADRFGAEPTYSERVIADPNARGAEGSQWDRAALSSILAQLERLERAVGRIAESLSVDLSDAGLWIEGNTVNLSGAGLGVHVPERIEEDSRLELEMTLIGDPTIVLRAVGRVVSLVRPDGDSLPVGRYHLGIGFHAINEEDREALVRYTFKLQREHLRHRHELVSDEF
ncbi:MAG: PilZ domain-containing protein [Acidobacteriota bacterium]|nr:PilZ domain-containing protein [Acidobacteriota bacterium]